MQDPVNLLAPDPNAMRITLVVFGLLVAVPIYLIVRFLRAYEQRSRPATDHASQATTIAELQNEVDTLRAEVARLTEAQEFTTKLLREQPSHELNAIRKDGTVKEH